MNDLVRQKLGEIVARHGASVATDARRCEALLRDHCGQYRREIFVLVSAVEEGVTRELAGDHGIPMPMLLARLTARLCDNRALSDDAAKWAVGSWAVALGVARADEIDRANAVPAAMPAIPPTAAAGGPTGGPAPPASVASLVVSTDGRGDFTTIGAAIGSAPPGARIEVRPGTYFEGLVLERRVEIVGDGPAEEIIVRSEDASCVRMETDEAAIRGLTLRGVGARGGGAFFAIDIPRGRLVLEDCDISSDSLSCLAIHGPGSSPVVRRCAIHDGADSGVYVFDHGLGTIEACDVFGNANVGIAITRGGNPMVKDCRIFGGRNAGVVSWDGGAGTIDGCEIFANAQAGVGISEGGNPVVAGCKIHGGRNSGVFVHDRGRGTIVRCDISGHDEAELAVTSGGGPLVQECSIHDGQVGVHVSDFGGGTIEACDITRNADAGVALRTGSDPTLRRCRIRANGGAGVWAVEGAAGTLVDCDLRGNAHGSWVVDASSAVRSSGNRE